MTGLLPKLALQVLGIKHRMIVGYRGGQDVFLAMQRGEVQFHSTSISTFRSRNAAFVKSGDGVGIAYLVGVDRTGGYQKSRYITRLFAIISLYNFALSFGVRFCVWKSTYVIPNRFSYPSAHS